MAIREVPLNKIPEHLRIPTFRTGPVPVDMVPLSLGGEGEEPVDAADAPDILSSGQAVAAPEERAFNQTQGGAATGFTRTKQEPAAPMTPRVPAALEQVATTAGTGAALGAVGGEILTGGAALARSFPGGARVAPLLETAAIATKAAGRPASAAAGALMGGTAEATKQASNAMGFPGYVGEGLAFVTGGVAPEMFNAARWLARKAAEAPALTITRKFEKEIAKKIMAKLEGKVRDLDDEEVAYLNKLLREIKSGAGGETAKLRLNEILQTAARRSRVRAGDEATQVISDAERAANNEIKNVLTGPGARSRASIGRLRARGDDALTISQQQRHNIGDDVDISTIGINLREKIVPRNQAQITARRSSFQATENAVTRITAEKEARGEFINALPEYDALIRGLKRELADEKHTPGVKSVFTKILNDVQSSKKDGKVSFERIDEARRNMGNVFKGKPPVGYEGIRAEQLRKHYFLTQQIQKKFAGKDMQKLLDDYNASSKELAKYSSKRGRKVTALDRYDAELFQTDPKLLPDQFFRSSEGVSDLIRLTGDKSAVVNAANDLVTHELAGLNAKAVRSYLDGTRREMFSALPEVRDSVVKYVIALERGEAIQRRTLSIIKRKEGVQGERVTAAQSRERGILSEGRAEEGRILSTGEREARTLSGRTFPARRVRELIEGGSKEEWALAAPEILATPGGAQTVSESVRQVMVDRIENESIKGITKIFNENVKPAMLATKLMPAQEVEFISSRLASIEKMSIPDPAKMKLAHRFLLQAFGGLAARAGANAGASTATSLVNLVPQ